MKLKVGTYNICHGADFTTQVVGDDDGTSRSTVSLEKCAQIIKELNCDVIGLNEVYNAGNFGREDFLNQAEKLAKLSNYPYFYYAQGFDWEWTDIGNVILSKHPITNIKTIPIPTIPENERTEDVWHEDRVILEADVNVDGTEVKFLISHFGLAKVELERIVNKCCEIIDNSTLPTFLMGDFNARPDNAELQKLNEKLKNCSQLTNDKTFTFSTYNPERIIDYIYVPKTATIKKYKVEKIVLSDHFPLTAEVEL